MLVVAVGDCHVDEKQSLERFYWLGRAVSDIAPDYVVFMGDFLTLNCLSAWDRSKRAKMEGRRYHLEVSAGNQALDLFERGMKDGNVLKSKAKKRMATPQLVYIEGNHEDRLTRYLDGDPTFAGSVGVCSDLNLAARGFIWVDYKACFTLNGVSFIHIPINAIGKPIGNPMVTQKALRLFHNSVVFGHTHTLDHSAEHRHGSPHLNQALSVGGFFDHEEEYTVGSKTDYWKGIVVLDIYAENRFDFTTMSISSLRRKYA